MENEYNQTDVAVAQLDTAIRLFLNDNDYFSSATLAGAAEEIFGKMLEDKNEVNALNADADHFLNLLPDSEKNVLRTKKGEKEGIINILNFQRNWLKHQDKENYTNFSDPKREASELLCRAVRNYVWLFNKTTDSIDRFSDYQTHEY
jgi:hypothetical protein